MSKIASLSQNVTKDRQDIQELRRIDVKRQDVSVNKKTREVIICSGLLFMSDEYWEPTIISHYFEDMKEWMIPHFHLFTKAYTTSAFEVNSRLYFDSSYYWKELAHGYQFTLVFRAHLENMFNDPGGGGGGIIISSLNPQLVTAPLYLDVKFIVFNENIWHEIQQSKD